MKDRLNYTQRIGNPRWRWFCEKFGHKIIPYFGVQFCANEICKRCGGYRLVSIKPRGNSSVISETTQGCEPPFSTTFKRRIR